jgi:peptidoglycan-N-acetylglucosamine deacetylase
MTWDPPYRHAALLALLAAASSLPLSAACSHRSSAEERTCRDTQALSAVRYRGSGLPPKTIALTFDDGPGARTSELSHWLKAHGVPAAFFVNGKMLTAGPLVLAEIVADGHVLGNHTQTHADLTTLGRTEIIAEVEQTDALIAPFVPDGRYMFRPPFGAYTDTTFEALESSAMKKYVGPVDWDIGSQMGPSQAADWDCWSTRGTSVPPVLDVKTCGDLYLAEIREKSSAVVLLHDPYFIDDDPTKGGTVDMVKYVVPLLLAEGFAFVRVDRVPSVAAALPPLRTTEPGEPAPISPERSTEQDAGAGASSERLEPGAAESQPERRPGGDSSEPCSRSPQIDRTKSLEIRRGRFR